MIEEEEAVREIPQSEKLERPTRESGRSVAAHPWHDVEDFLLHDLYELAANADRLKEKDARGRNENSKHTQEKSKDNKKIKDTKKLKELKMQSTVKKLKQI